MNTYFGLWYFFLFFEVPSENISSTLLQKILQTDIDLKFILSQSLAAEEIRTIVFSGCRRSSSSNKTFLGINIDGTWRG